MVSRSVDRNRGAALGRRGMGEVRVRARLTNAFDESLLRRGMIEPEQVRAYGAEALVDPGALRTVLPQEVVARLSLEVRGQLVVTYADGRTEAVGLTEPLVVGLARAGHAGRRAGAG